MADFKENCIEWLNGDETATVTLSQGRYISKVKRLKEKFPDKVEIVAENKDGSIVAHLPVKAIKLSIIDASGRDNSRALEALNAWRESQTTD